MKTQKTVYLYACTNNINLKLVSAELKNKYKIIGNGKTMQSLYHFNKESIDYLIIFANRKRFTNLDKHYLNYLWHVFKHIVVVGKTKIHILQHYTFIEQQITNNSLHTILTIIENGLNKAVCYSYSNFTTNCANLLNELGFKPKHKGFQYIIDCAYNIILSNHKNNLNTIYQNIAQQNNVTSISVERAIRSCKTAALKTQNANEIKEISLKDSNKKFIENLNKYVVNHLL